MASSQTSISSCLSFSDNEITEIGSLTLFKYDLRANTSGYTSTFTTSDENGTSFYVKDKEKKFVLHSVIGFKENRAVLFDGSILHASSQYMDSSKPRHIMTNFFWNRETE